MQTVVIGGHTRNIGKTSVMCALIREFAPRGWTAVKITQYGHGICSHDGKPCGCEPREHAFALSEELDAGSRSDTSRFLAAGATRSLWLRVRDGQLATAWPTLARRLAGAERVILESNRVREFVQPDLHLMVLDRSQPDFKASAAAWIERADAFVDVHNRGTGTAPGRPHAGIASTTSAPSLPASIPIFKVEPPDYWSPALAEFVRSRLDAAEASARDATDENRDLEVIWPR